MKVVLGCGVGVAVLDGPEPGPADVAAVVVVVVGAAVVIVAKIVEMARKPYEEGKPGRKKQGREGRGKQRNKKEWKQRNPLKEPPPHTPSRKD